VIKEKYRKNKYKPISLAGVKPWGYNLADAWQDLSIINPPKKHR